MCDCGNPIYAKGMCKTHYFADYRKQNKEKIRTRNQLYEENNKEWLLKYRQTYYKKNKSRLQSQMKQWRIENRDILRQKQNTYRAENPSARLAHNLRGRLASGLRAGSAVKDLGCSIDELKQYLENQFLVNIRGTTTESGT